MSNVTRDGDTVTVRCCYEPENDCLVVRPYDDDHFRPVLYGFPILERADLAAFGDACHALAGEPDSVILPRAEVEALRARAERLRATLSRLEPMMRLADWYAVMDDGLAPGDLADDLSPLKLAGNPLDDGGTG